MIVQPQPRINHQINHGHIQPSNKNSTAISREFGKDLTNIENIQHENNKKKFEANSMECRIKMIGKKKIDLGNKMKKLDVKIENFKKIQGIYNLRKSTKIERGSFVNGQNLMNRTLTLANEPKTFRERETKNNLEKKKSENDCKPNDPNSLNCPLKTEINSKIESSVSSEELLDKSEDKDPQNVDEYFEDIVNEYFLNEKEFLPVSNYMKTVQKDINNNMRGILNDWLIDVHLKYKFTHETMFLAVNILDRYLSKVDINRNILQLVGVTALMIAGKYEEIYPPQLKVYSYITDDTYTQNEVKKMESQILKTLDFNTTITSPLKFTQVLQKVLKVGNTAYFYCEYLLDLCLMDVKMISFFPSELAGAAVYLGLKICEKRECLKEVAIQSRSTEEKIKNCANEMISLLSRYEKGALKAVKNKYASTKFGGVSKIALTLKI